MPYVSNPGESFVRGFSVGKGLMQRQEALDIQRQLAQHKIEAYKAGVEDERRERAAQIEFFKGRMQEGMPSFGGEQPPPGVLGQPIMDPTGFKDPGVRAAAIERYAPHLSGMMQPGPGPRAQPMQAPAGSGGPSEFTQLSLPGIQQEYTDRMKALARFGPDMAPEVLSKAFDLVKEARDKIENAAGRRDAFNIVNDMLRAEPDFFQEGSGTRAAADLVLKTLQTEGADADAELDEFMKVVKQGAAEDAKRDTQASLVASGEEWIKAGVASRAVDTGYEATQLRQAIKLKGLGLGTMDEVDHWRKEVEEPGVHEKLDAQASAARYRKAYEWTDKQWGYMLNDRGEPPEGVDKEWFFYLGQLEYLASEGGPKRPSHPMPAPVAKEKGFFDGWFGGDKPSANGAASTVKEKRARLEELKRQRAASGG